MVEVAAIALTAVVLTFGVLFALSLTRENRERIDNLERHIDHHANVIRDHVNISRHDTLERLRLLEEYLEVEYKEKSIVAPHYTEKED